MLKTPAQSSWIISMGPRMKSMFLTMFVTARSRGTLMLDEAPACTQAQLNHSIGLHNYTLVVQNRQRRFLLYIPKFYPAESPVSLWILAPGAYNEPEKQIEMSEMILRAEEQQFAFVALRGEDNLMNVVRHSRPLPERPNDVEYTRAVIEELRMTLCIDSRRIFCTGYSRGARFCMLLASELPGYVAAVAPVGGIRFPDPNNATRPIPIIAFHGTDDPVNPYSGDGNPEYWYDSVPEAMSKWVAFNGCKMEDARRITASVFIERHWDCTADANVVLIKILGGGHTWPGSKYDWDPALGNVTYEISASEVMGQFFSVHPMAKAVAGQMPTATTAACNATLYTGSAVGTGSSYLLKGMGDFSYQGNVFPNDAINSMTVRGPCAVTVYENCPTDIPGSCANGPAGTAITLTAGDHDNGMGLGGNQLSHVRIQETPKLSDSAFRLLKRQMQGDTLARANAADVQQPGPLNKAASRKRHFR